MAQTSVVSFDKCVGLFSTQQADLDPRLKKMTTDATPAQQWRASRVAGEPGGGGAGGRRRYEQLTQHPRNTLGQIFCTVKYMRPLV